MGLRDAAIGALTVAGGRAGPGLTAVLEAVWQGVVELGHGAVQAVQRDGWRQQQRGRGEDGGSAAPITARSFADVEVYRKDNRIERI
jgi:hypothetical protein